MQPNGTLKSIIYRYGGKKDMKHILLNLKSFFRHEKLIFFVIIICVISSAFIINFSYGLYYNYITQKNESYDNMKEIIPEIREGKVLTKEDFRRYIESLSEQTLSSINRYAFFASIEEVRSTFYYDDNGNYVDSPMPFQCIFAYQNGRYCMPSDLKPSQSITGEDLSDEDEANGNYVAYLNLDYFDAPQNKGVWNEDGTVTIFGKKYEVKGTSRVLTGAMRVPFLTIPDDLQLNRVGIFFERNVTRAQYNELISQAARELPEMLIFPELESPDIDSIAIYNNMIVISFCISVLSLINFAMLYRFVLKKRQRQLAILRMCGCKKSRAVFTYLAECAFITLPAYGIGMLINYLLVHNVLNKVFNYIEEAYSPTVYGSLLGVYMAAFVVILLIMTVKNVNHTIVETWRE